MHIIASDVSKCSQGSMPPDPLVGLGLRPSFHRLYASWLVPRNIPASGGDAITEYNTDRERGPPTVMKIIGLYTDLGAHTAAMGYIGVSRPVYRPGNRRPCQGFGSHYMPKWCHARISKPRPGRPHRTVCMEEMAEASTPFSKPASAQMRTGWFRWNLVPRLIDTRRFRKSKFPRESSSRKSTKLFLILWNPQHKF